MISDNRMAIVTYYPMNKVLKALKSKLAEIVCMKISRGLVLYEEQSVKNHF